MVAIVLLVVVVVDGYGNDSSGGRSDSKIHVPLIRNIKLLTFKYMM